MSNARDAYVKMMKAKLDEWNADIAKLEAKAQKNQAKVQKEFQKQVDNLKAQRKSAEEKLDDMQQVSEDAWKDLKIGVEHAADSLADALRSATSRFL